MGSIGATELLIVAILIAVFIALIFLFLVKSVRSGSQDTANQNDASAEEVLERRYASGELTQEEYLTIRDDIKREQNA